MASFSSGGSVLTLEVLDFQPLLLPWLRRAATLLLLGVTRGRLRVYLAEAEVSARSAETAGRFLRSFPVLLTSEKVRMEFGQIPSCRFQTF